MAAADDGEQHQQEFALLNQIGLAGLKDDLGDVEHRLVGGQIVNLPPQVQADAQRAGDHQRPVQQQVPAADFLAGDVEGAGVQVGNRQIGLARHRGGGSKQQQSKQTGNQLRAVHGFSVCVPRAEGRQIAARGLNQLLEANKLAKRPPGA